MHIVCYTDGCLCSMKYQKYIIIYFSNSVEVTAGYIEVLFQIN